jgi:transcriptional regulator with XRE-family HTH domain
MMSAPEASNTDRKPNPVDVAVGQNVKLRRLAVGLSQEKLGEQMGLTFQQIQKYEKGTNRIGASRMVQIARALDCAVRDLFAGCDQGEVGPPIPQFSAAEIKLVLAFRAIESETRRAVIINLTAAMAREPTD